MLTIGRNLGMNSKILIIGASGFLGRALVKEILSKTTNPRFLYRTERIDDRVAITSMAPHLNHQTTMEEFFAEGDCNFEIINCASVRYPRADNDSQRGNFDTPKMILENAICRSNQVIKWIQPESFWQYTQDRTPDPEYVQWKNNFGLVLEEFSHMSKIQYQKVVLPHLFGVNDDMNRFFPKLFKKLLNQATVNISGGGDIFAIADVADVSSYFVQLLAENAFQFRDNLVIFPYHEITLRDLVGEFISDSSSQPTIIWEKTSTATNPTMNLARDFIGRRLDLTLTPIERSVSNIRSWLTQNVD